MAIKQKQNALIEISDEDEHILSLREFSQIIWRRLWTILLTVLVLVGTVIGYSLMQTPLYEASIKILVGQEQSNSSEALQSEVVGLQQLTQTMTEAIKTRPVAESVIQQQNLRISSEDFLDNNLSVQQVSNTQFIEVSYKAPIPERAQEVANSVGEVFSTQVSTISPSATGITATVWESAAVPQDPVSPNLLLNGLVALIMGLMLGIGLACLLEYLDDSWRSPEETELITGVPNFGVIPKFELTKSKKAARTK